MSIYKYLVVVLGCITTYAQPPGYPHGLPNNPNGCPPNNPMCPKIPLDNEIWVMIVVGFLLGGYFLLKLYRNGRRK